MNSLIRVCEVDLWDILSFFVIIVDALRSCFSGLYEVEVLVTDRAVSTASLVTQSLVLKVLLDRN